MRKKLSTNGGPLNKKDIRDQALANIKRRIKKEKGTLFSSNDNDFLADYGHLVEQEVSRLETLYKDRVSFPIEETIWERKERRAKAERQKVARHNKKIERREKAKRDSERKERRGEHKKQVQLDHQKERERMQEMVKERAITRVCHFTRYENLKSIHQWGIRSTRFLQGKKDIEFRQNDSGRHDNHLGISCSVQFPNAPLLNKWMKHDFPDAQWIMFYIDPSVIWENGQVNKFCQTNAAFQGGAMIRPGLKGFEEMFKNKAQSAKGEINRDRKLASRSTTDVQAEILLDQKIGWEKIHVIVTHDKAIKEEIIKDFPNVKVSYDPKAFDFGHIERARKSR